MELMLTISEKKVKELIHSYFGRFKFSGSIPEEYSNFIKLLESSLPKQFIKPDSLLYIPETSKGIDIIISDGPDYKLNLIITNQEHKWEESYLCYFHPDDIPVIKKKIGQILNSAHLTFAHLRRIHKELKTIYLLTDPENLTIKIKDQKFPEYEHPARISFWLGPDLENI